LALLTDFCAIIVACSNFLLERVSDLCKEEKKGRRRRRKSVKDEKGAIRGNKVDLSRADDPEA